ncbi:hypothetical protein B0H13DRAFT_2440030 [Mycena leptocephala]|nr:hypothetical protein B0H13DRAFT_2440030 [Mycena leptocephala]
MPVELLRLEHVGVCPLEMDHYMLYCAIDFVNVLLGMATSATSCPCKRLVVGLAVLVSMVSLFINCFSANGVELYATGPGPTIHSLNGTVPPPPLPLCNSLKEFVVQGHCCDILRVLVYPTLHRRTRLPAALLCNSIAKTRFLLLLHIAASKLDSRELVPSASTSPLRASCSRFAHRRWVSWEGKYANCVITAHARCGQASLRAHACGYHSSLPSSRASFVDTYTGTHYRFAHLPLRHDSTHSESRATCAVEMETEKRAQIETGIERLLTGFTRCT